MAEVKVSALTALTGANVANGDELYIVDTGSPNVSKKITADELAQMPQLSSRYEPLQLIATATATAGAMSVTFNNIPQTFSDLELRWICNGVSSGGQVFIRFNNDTGSNYDWVVLGRTTAGTATVAQAEGATIGALGTTLANGGAGSAFINGYTTTIAYKTCHSVCSATESTGNYKGSIDSQATVWRNTAAITRIDIGANFGGGFVAGSVFRLYGRK